MIEGVLDISHLSKGYNGTIAVNDLTFKLPENSICGLVGPNGSGKTTLIRMLMGIIQPDNGDITLWGQNYSKNGPDLRNRIGYIPDVPYMYPAFSCGDMLRLGSKLYREWDWEKCCELSNAFEIPLNTKISALSLGFKTRVSAVMALSIKPRLLVLDEPAASLDPPARAELRQRLIDEVAQNGTTVFYSTHDLKELERIGDHIAVIRDGKLLCHRPIDEMKESFHRIQFLLDNPQGNDRLIKFPGVISIDDLGRAFSMLVEGSWLDITSHLKDLGAQQIERMDITLEECVNRLLKWEK